MSYFVKITRTPYEEPFHLQLLLEVSNGKQAASLEIYLNTDSLREMADGLEKFPRHATDNYLFELGSERQEDRWAYYLRLRAFVTDGLGHSALLFRMNNNRDLPHRQLAEFCIEAEPANINRLGTYLHAFSKLEHRCLYWAIDESTLE
jgi:hypothetical protein